MAFQSLPMPGDGTQWLGADLAMPLFEAWNGYGSAPMGLTGINDDIYAAATLRNRGLGAAFLAQDTAGTTDLMTIDDLGTSLTNLFGSGTADINGATDLGDTLHGVGAVTFDDTLDVAGDGTFAANVEILGDLHVVGAVTFDDTLDVTGDGTFAANVEILGDLHVVGAVAFDDILDVTGAVTLADTISVTGDGTFAANVAITGDLTVGGTLTVTGTTAFTGAAAFAQPATFALGLVITTGGITLTPSTPGQRILGDFSNAAVLNRTLFQTSVANGLTGIDAIPNGSGLGAAFEAYSTANPAASARLIMYAGTTNHYLISDHAGAAYLPLQINVGGLAAQQFQINGDIVLGSGAAKKIGAFGSAGAVQPVAVAAATDLATVVALANNLRTGLRALGWFA